MTAAVDDGFSVQDLATTAQEFQTESQKPDELWVERLRNIPIGQSFTVNRPEGETVRQFKKRINRAAMVHWKTLEWKTRDTNLPDGVEATHFSAKIKTIDTKKKAEAEAKAALAAQNTQNGTQEGQQTTNGQTSTTDSSTEGAEAAGPRRANRG